MKTKFTNQPWKKEVRTSKRDRSRIVVAIPTQPQETELVFGFLGSDDCAGESCCKVEEHANALLAASSPDMALQLISIREHMASCLLLGEKMSLGDMKAFFGSIGDVLGMAGINDEEQTTNTPEAGEK